MTEEIMEPQATAASPEPDPGNSDPEVFTEDLTDEELLDANLAVEEAIQSLPKDNEGVL